MSNSNSEAIVKCETSKGPITLKLIRKWSPIGYERALNLFSVGFYDNSHFFRNVPNFLVQFGITYNENLKKYGRDTILDDPQLDPPIRFEEGLISFAGSGPNSRTSHLFIAYGAIPSLGRELWETPIGKIVDGMDNIRNFNGQYGDKGPKQWKIKSEGVNYINKNFPLTETFGTCQVTSVDRHGEIDGTKESNDEKHSNSREDNNQRRDSNDLAVQDSISTAKHLRNSKKANRIDGSLKVFKEVQFEFLVACFIISVLSSIFFFRRQYKRLQTKVS